MGNFLLQGADQQNSYYGGFLRMPAERLANVLFEAMPTKQGGFAPNLPIQDKINNEQQGKYTISMWSLPVNLFQFK